VAQSETHVAPKACALLKHPQYCKSVTRGHSQIGPVSDEVADTHDFQTGKQNKAN